MASLIVSPVAFSVKATTPAVPVTASAGATVILVPVPGGQGQRGPAGDGAQVFNETPSGAVDAINDQFTTAHPFQPGTTCVYINGLREKLGVGYVETGDDSIAFTQPPFFGAELIIDYLQK